MLKYYFKLVETDGTELRNGTMFPSPLIFFLGGLEMSKVTTFSSHGKSLAELTVLTGIKALYAQYFMSCGKRREVACVM